MHWGFLFIWIIGAWLVWALLQDNRICFGSAQLSDEAFEEMPFRGIGIMDDDQRAALVGYLLMRPVVERIELCSQVQSQGRIRFLDYADVLLGQLATGVIPAVQNGAVDLFWVSGDLHAVSYTHLDVYKRQRQANCKAIVGHLSHCYVFILETSRT